MPSHCTMKAQRAAWDFLVNESALAKPCSGNTFNKLQYIGAWTHRMLQRRFRRFAPQLTRFSTGDMGFYSDRFRLRLGQCRFRAQSTASTTRRHTHLSRAKETWKLLVTGNNQGGLEWKLVQRQLGQPKVLIGFNLAATLHTQMARHDVCPRRLCKFEPLDPAGAEPNPSTPENKQF